MEIVNERVSTVEVTMRGADLSGKWFNTPLPTCVVDLQRAGEGEHTVTITRDNVRTPKGSGIEILQVNPARVLLVLERTISKEVPIVVPLKGKPPRGHEVYGQTQNPARLTITGPQSRIESISAVSTEPISLSEQTQSARFFVNLHIKNNAIRTSWVDAIQVDIQIGPSQKR
jgi:YbbR domain-containing protein